MKHDATCTGCPRCSTEMADLMSARTRGNWRGLSAQLTTLTERHLRVLRGERDGQPVEAPPSVGDALRRQHQPSSDRLRDHYISNRPPAAGPAPARSYPKEVNLPPP